jgi:hypothetical protein
MDELHADSHQFPQDINDLVKRIERLENARFSQSPVSLPPPEKMEKLKYYRQENRHEWNLLSNRVSSYITSQSFLVTAYAVSMGNQNPKWGDWFTLIFPLIVSIIGVATSLRARPGINGAVKILKLWHKKQDRLFFQNPDEAEKDRQCASEDLNMIDFNDGRPMIIPKHSKEESNKIESIDEIHNTSLHFATTAPWLFGISWLCFATLTIVLHVLFA